MVLNSFFSNQGVRDCGPYEYIDELKLNHNEL